MKPFMGKIGLIGAGAMGGLYGAKLFQAGHDVHFLMRRDYDAVRRNGLKVFSHMGDFEIRPPVYDSAAALGRCDLVIVGLKTTDNASLAELLAPVVGPETLVLTLQNGLGNEEEIARVMGLIGHPESREPATRVLGGVAFVCCNRTEPGVLRHTDHGWIRLAEFSGPARERTHAIAEMFRSAGLTIEVHDSLAQIRWMKLVWNVPFNGLGVGAGHATSRMVLEDETLLRVARGLMEEVVAGARADGVAIAPGYIDNMIAATESMGHYKSSMQIDYEAGRPLEVESILGEPVRRACRAGIPTPRMEFLYGVVRRLDALRRGGTKDAD
jgi:2-dehydropantoate 2-reductase